MRQQTTTLYCCDSISFQLIKKTQDRIDLSLFVILQAGFGWIQTVNCISNISVSSHRKVSVRSQMCNCQTKVQSFISNIFMGCQKKMRQSLLQNRRGGNTEVMAKLHLEFDETSQLQVVKYGERIRTDAYFSVLVSWLSTREQMSSTVTIE